ncbi:MAG: EAL domain-containing protein [Epsilonproteobacteria bacterium]|nr:EAL domain-containing protein [Campylobacterota bacterium]
MNKRCTSSNLVFLYKYSPVIFSENFIFVLIEIEDFYYINIPMDKSSMERVQLEFAKILFELRPKELAFSKIYILDNGKFAFFKEDRELISDIDFVAKSLKRFQKRVNMSNTRIDDPIEYELSIKISLSYGKNAYKKAKLGLATLDSRKEDFIVSESLLEKKQSLAIEKLKTFQMVRRAINSYRIISYFQPIVNNRSGVVEKYESLVRLIDENDNVLTPNRFLDIAKERKYYTQITSIVLTNSFEALSHTDADISINISSIDIEKETTVKKFFELLERHESYADRVVLEILEDEKFKNIENMKQFIERARGFGVQIAIDDFGTGYSNFKRVLEYKPDILKIDGSLIRNIEKDEFSRHMVEAIIAFSKKQNIKTVAEFVENETIFNIVCSMGIDYSQGYYFGKADTLEGMEV